MKKTVFSVASAALAMVASLPVGAATQKPLSCHAAFPGTPVKTVSATLTYVPSKATTVDGKGTTYQKWAVNMNGKSFNGDFSESTNTVTWRGALKSTMGRVTSADAMYSLNVKTHAFEVATDSALAKGNCR